MATNEAPPAAFQPNPYSITQDQLLRKRAIADALLQSSFARPQGQMVSGHYIAPGILGQLSPLVSALVSQKIQKGINSSQQELSSQYGQAKQAELQQVIDQSKTDPRGAAIRAQSSTFPEIQQIGKSLFEKGVFGTGDVDKYKDIATPSSIVEAAQTGNTGAVTPMGKQTTVEGRIVYGDPSNPTKQTVLGNYNDRFGPQQNGPEGTVVQQNLSGGKDAVTPGRAFTSVAQLAPNVAAVEAIKHAYERLDPAYEGALGAQQAYSNLTTAEQALKNAYTGTGAGVATELTRGLQTLGFSNDRIAKMRSTAEMKNALVQASAQLAKSQVGARVSNYEEQIFQKIGSSGDSTPAEVQAAIDIGKARAANSIIQFHGQLKGASSDPDVAPHLGTYGAVAPIQLQGQQFKVDPATGLYTLDDSQLPESAAGVTQAKSTNVTGTEVPKSPNSISHTDFLKRFPPPAGVVVTPP